MLSETLLVYFIHPFLYSFISSHIFWGCLYCQASWNLLLSFFHIFVNIFIDVSKTAARYILTWLQQYHCAIVLTFYRTEANDSNLICSHISTKNKKTFTLTPIFLLHDAFYLKELILFKFCSLCIDKYYKIIKFYWYFLHFNFCWF